MKAPIPIETIYAEYTAFIQPFKTLLLATASPNGTPEASYAPFVRGDGADVFYIYISELAQHTANLTANGQVSVLFIENEVETGQLFARQRLTFSCTATLVERDCAEWQQVIAQFSTEFGDIMEMLRTLTDFKLFRIVPHAGNYVRGFAQAYHISGEDLDKIAHRQQAHQRE